MLQQNDIMGHMFKDWLHIQEFSEPAKIHSAKVCEVIHSNPKETLVENIKHNIFDLDWSIA